MARTANTSDIANTTTEGGVSEKPPRRKAIIVPCFIDARKFRQGCHGKAMSQGSKVATMGYCEWGRESAIPAARAENTHDPNRTCDGFDNFYRSDRRGNRVGEPGRPSFCQRRGALR